MQLIQGRIIIIALGLAAGSASAWVLPKELRHAAASAATAATILATTQPLVAHAIDFSGQYSDPKHPNCKREIVLVDRTTVKITGTDGTPGCPADGSGRPWELLGKINGDSILVDFTPKGGPANLEGIYDDETSPESIKWPDGNRWTMKESKSGVNLEQDNLM